MVNSTRKLYHILKNEIRENSGKEMVIICVGTDRSTGDSLGPLVGTILSEMKIKNFIVYGNIDEPVHATNLEETLNMVNQRHPNSFVIGIDACLGRKKSIGKISIKQQPLKPGAGVKKELPEVGHCSIVGVVNISGFMEYLVLQNTRLSLVMKMANEIAGVIKLADRYLFRNSKIQSEVAATITK
ncbi:spore protease YyaC [Heyndrickxia oleronia]|uniref:spore protease YyaC n=1 Tax=Heyndrickxia oleronia TaxID=38875 RepID=UPI001F27B1B1|nr:spore protease YyaC [Heyndrickxia oleronia]